VAKRKSAMQEAFDYHEKYGAIPKDYMDRLAWLYQEVGFTQKHLTDLLEKMDKLANTSWNEVNYIFYMTPKPTPRPRLSPNTFVFYVSGAKMNQEIFKNFVEQHSEMECVISTPCAMDTKVYIQTPNGMSIEEKVAAELGVIHNINAPDWDNLGKTYSDMVQDVLVSNDSLVFRGSVQKFYSVLPRIEVKVTFMTEYDCKYNKRSVEKRKSFQENEKTLKDLDFII
jgi:Holliday junction resolvase RusA-like endonuclease